MDGAADGTPLDGSCAAARLSYTPGMPLVTLLTDFGTADGYVGAMKGVVLSIARDASIVDVTHDIAPQDVRAGAWALAQASATFPPGSIHLAVVDPEVGTKRRALLVRAASRLYVGPDNGLLSWVQGAEEATVWQLDRPELHRSPVSATFHGRDVFASIAGHLAAGLRPEQSGTKVESWVRLPRIAPLVTPEGEVHGEVVHVDRFGNLITNVDSALLANPGSWSVTLGSRQIGFLRRTFGEVACGDWVAFLGSSGAVEIAIRNRNAGAEGVSRGDKVSLCRSR